MAMLMRLVFFVCFVMWVGTAHVQAKIQEQTIPYTHGETQLQGYLVWDDSVKGKRPGILVVHEWWGLNAYAKARAKQLAEMGYVAFAADMYGKGKVTDHPKQAGEWMKETTANVQRWQARATEGLKILQKQEMVDAENMAAIGYCFGGATVTQLAYSGALVKGVVSFHGALPLPSEGQAIATNAKVLIAHGNEDPFLKEDHIQKFRSALEKADFDWQMVIYAGARHSFTNPDADKVGMDALKYNKKADERSWKHMQLFFDELFKNE
ncbi:MAG: hypothetical protein NPIRA01_10220 [Nitrospirales bacterium]|nr:MAG: hypothetical protein NPIRA01_10220 [Nitrospirales bacterium]